MVEVCGTNKLDCLKRYEDSSLEYIGINRHQEEQIGGYNTVLDKNEF